jgi:hypothetical protein
MLTHRWHIHWGSHAAAQNRQIKSCLDSSLVECPPCGWGSNPGRGMSLSWCLIEGWRKPWSSSLIRIRFSPLPFPSVRSFFRSFWEKFHGRKIPYLFYLQVKGSGYSSEGRCDIIESQNFESTQVRDRRLFMLKKFIILTNRRNFVRGIFHASLVLLACRSRMARCQMKNNMLLSFS